MKACEEYNSFGSAPSNKRIRVEQALATKLYGLKAKCYSYQQVFKGISGTETGCVWFFKGIGTILETINNLLNVNHAPLLSFAVPEMVVETSTVYHAMNASKYVSGNISQGLKLDGGQRH